jgi:hypothetical protein
MPTYRINPLALDTFGRLAGVRAYLDLVDTAMPQIEFQERERLKEFAEDHGWEAGDYFTEDQVLDERFRHWVPRFSAYSAIILLYSVLEVQLTACAVEIGRKHSVPFHVTDVGGQGIERAILYIKRITKHNSKEQPEWPAVSDLSKLRNLIVHRIGTRGESDEHRKAADELAGRYPSQLTFPPVGQWTYGEAWLSIPLCRRFIEAVERFFIALYIALDLPTKGAELRTE